MQSTNKPLERWVRVPGQRTMFFSTASPDVIEEYFVNYLTK